MEEKTWIDYITAIGSIATPILVAIVSTVMWKLKSSIERKTELENKLRSDRIDIYNQILEPFIMAFTPDDVWNQDKKNKNKDKNEIVRSKMLSLDYRKIGFKLSLMGSDAVVISYNNLMQYFYKRTDSKFSHDSNDSQKILEVLGKFLLAIRKSMGNETTKLDYWAMCEWWVTDIQNIKDKNNEQQQK